MYEEIDKSGHTKWDIIALFGFISVVGLLAFRLFAMPIDIPPQIDQIDVIAIIGFSPLAAMLIGSFIGYMKKRTTKINTELLEFTEETREIDDFGKVYFEGDTETPELGGHPAYTCGWVIILIMSPFLGFGILFGMDVVEPIIGSIIEMLLAAILYSAGFVFAFKSASMTSKLVRNPLYFRITKYVTKMDVLLSMMQCDLVSSVIVKYRVGKGQSLKTVDNIRVFLVTSTDPALEVEVTINKMENIGPEYTYHFVESNASRYSNSINVSGKDAILTIDEVDMRSIIKIRYDMNRVRARWNLATPSSLCDLIHALLDEVKKHADFRPVQKAEKLVTSKDQFDELDVL